MLRASSEFADQQVDLSVITKGTDATSGVKGETALLNLVEETVMHPGSDNLRHARDAVLDELGPQALVDTAAVIGNFQRMTRIADGTGIPLDDMMTAMTVDIRRDLKLNEFGAAYRTKETSLFKRLMIRTMFPIMMRRIRKRAQAQAPIHAKGDA
ncbi:MAG: hypothetical protein O3A63_13860 [Proteobacteria bacterium]|nr:hypothetical protein [Pseudomonadota bacterium]